MISSANDISIVRNMMLTQSYKQIAQLLNYSEEEIQDAVKLINHELNLVTFQDKLNAKKKVKVNVKKDKVREEIFKEQVLKNKAERMRIERQRALERRRPEETFITRKIDYKEKVMLRIDRNTYIYAEVGKEKQAKEDFLKIYKGTNLK